MCLYLKITQKIYAHPHVRNINFLTSNYLFITQIKWNDTDATENLSHAEQKIRRKEKKENICSFPLCEKKKSFAFNDLEMKLFYLF